MNTTTNTTETKNTYSKFCANVFVAKTPQQHERGEIIILTTKYGQEHENEVHNFLGKTRDGFYLYSITRADGFNHQERARRKAEKLQGYSTNAENRSTKAYEASHEGRDFLSLGEPIKIGHHSERRHRALIQRNWDRMSKSVAEQQKAEDYRNRAEYWEHKANTINLSQPESLNFFEFKLEEAKKNQQFLKDNPEARAHSYSLTYATKEVKELTEKVQTAIKLWGDPEDIDQMNKEREDEAKAKALKGKKGDKINALIEELGGFFFFGNDIEDFKNKVKVLRESGKLEDGEKVYHVGAGLYMPHKHIERISKAK
jgi:hypothetical protein